MSIRDILPPMCFAAAILFMPSLWIPTSLAAGLPVRGASSAHCAECHDCADPTAKNPCLRSCPRPVSPSVRAGDSGPDVVILDELENLYVPVRFNHKIHAQMADMGAGCKVCHHYQTENPTRPSACKTCHPKEIIHDNLAQPGLKGAYHRQCLGCHSQWDRETACEICHGKRAAGKLHGMDTTFSIHSHYRPIELKELIVFPTDTAGGAVPFHHRRHATKYEHNCSVCHHQESCNVCHLMGQTTPSHPMGEIHKADMHAKCYQCHRPGNCGHCHGRGEKDQFTHDATGWPLKAYHARLDCRSCHAGRVEYMKLDARCESCHPNGWPEDRFHHAVTGVTLDETHRQAGCKDCHTQGVPKKPDCAGCHDDGRKYNPKRGFAAR